MCGNESVAIMAVLTDDRLTGAGAASGPVDVSDSIPDAPHHLTNRRSRQFRSASTHSSIVRSLKFALPVLAVAMGAAFVLYSWAGSPTSIGFDMSSTAIRDGKLVMASPKLEGFTADNLPYSMNAVRALQDVGNTNIITMEDVDASFPMTNGTTATVTAEHAVYDRLQNAITLDRPMTLSTSDGKYATLQNAFINIAAGTLASDSPIRIQMEGVTIEAERLSVSQSGKHIILENRVRMNLDPGRLNAERAQKTKEQQG